MSQLKESGSKLNMEAGKVGAGKHMEAWAWSVCCDSRDPKDLHVVAERCDSSISEISEMPVQPWH